MAGELLRKDTAIQKRVIEKKKASPFCRKAFS